MADAEDIASKTKQLIQDYVEEHWTSTQSACYFSSIGTHLSHTAPESRAALSNGLGEFLRQNPVVRVIQFPEWRRKLPLYLSPLLCREMLEDYSYKASRRPLTLIVLLCAGILGRLHPPY